MSKAGLASAVAACLPTGVMERILAIWESQADVSVVMHFKDGRCLRMEATDIKQFKNEDFEESV